MSNLADDIKWVLSFKAMSSLSWNTTQQVPLAGILAVNRNVPVLEATEQAWLCPSGRDCYPFARDFVLYISELEPPGCGESWRGSRMRLFSRIQMSPAISKDRAGTYTFIHYPGAPGLPDGRVETSWQGRRKSEFDELCSSGSVSCLYSEGTELDILEFPHQW